MAKRTPEIAEVTANRKVSTSKLKLLVYRLRKYCNSDPIQSIKSTLTQQSQDLQRLLRSAGENPSNYRVICLCPTCNGCHVELFEREYLRAKMDLPLACDHKLNVVDLVLEDSSGICSPRWSYIPLVTSCCSLPTSCRVRKHVSDVFGGLCCPLEQLTCD